MTNQSNTKQSKLPIYSMAASNPLANNVNKKRNRLMICKKS